MEKCNFVILVALVVVTILSGLCNSAALDTLTGLNDTDTTTKNANTTKTQFPIKPKDNNSTTVSALQSSLVLNKINLGSSERSILTGRSEAFNLSTLTKLYEIDSKFNDFSFKVQVPGFYGILMVVQNLVTGNETLSDGSCANFIEVTHMKSFRNVTKPKICDEVKKNSTSTTSGLRTFVFPEGQGQIYVRVKFSGSGKSTLVSGELVFTQFKYRSKCSEIVEKPCSAPLAKNGTNTSSTSVASTDLQVCVSSFVFCDGFNNCDAGPGSKVSYDEIACSPATVASNRAFNAGTAPGSTSYRQSYSYSSSGARIPIIIPIWNSRPAYNPIPSGGGGWNYRPAPNINTNWNYKPPPNINTNWNYKIPDTNYKVPSYSVPKYSSGVSTGGGKVSKGAGKIWKFIIGGILAMFGGIASICGCSKKKENPECQVEAATGSEPTGNDNERERNLRFLHAVYRPEDTAPRSVIVLGYTPLNRNDNSNDTGSGAPNSENVDNNALRNQPPPSYQESTGPGRDVYAKSNEQPPPPYQNC